MGWRAPPPATADRVVWPAGFGQRYIVTVDTEEEFDWTAGFARANRAVTHTRALPDAMRRFAEAGATPILLVDHPIASDPAAVDAVRACAAMPGVAVGAQLHPWVNPPFGERVHARNSFLGNLPPAMQAAKIAALTDAIAGGFGRRPASFRAGRYGLGAATLALIADAGYRIDMSMRARFDYVREGGPDYGAIGAVAFRAEGLVEVPFTTILTGRLRGAGITLHRLAARVPFGVGLVSRTGLLERVSLTPEGTPLTDALEAVRIAHGEGLALFSLAFHSPSLVPGHTPYVRDAAALARFWAWWDGVLALFDRLGVAAASEDDLLGAI